MWCALGDDTLVSVQERYVERVPITWKVALINDGKPMDAGLDQELWYYDRCEAATGRRFDHRWGEKRGQSTWLPKALIHISQKLWKGAEGHCALKIAALQRVAPILRWGGRVFFAVECRRHVAV